LCRGNAKWWTKHGQKWHLISENCPSREMMSFEAATLLCYSYNR
jgi:hypothetical protein